MAESREGPTFVAIGGGKGGVGKTLVASSLAIALARRTGEGSPLRVVAVDLDVGGSNLNLFLGEPLPRHELTDFLEGRVESLDMIAHPTRALPNLRLVAGSMDLVSAGDPVRPRKLALVRALVGLDADVVVLDLPAGTSPATLDFFFLGDTKIVVTNPETAAFHDAYGFLKSYLLRRLITELRDRQDLLFRVLEWFRDAPPDEDRTLTGLVESLQEERPDVAPIVVSILSDDTPWLVLNRLRKPRERIYLDRFRAVVRRHLGLATPELGTIPDEEKIAQSARTGRPFVLEHPKHRISRVFDTWADRIARAR
ncbi:MAG: P-loop NTPase [Gemmatimonadota bacterium]|nr:P-loop NTPase [Gemmatimonadota bacterium]